MTNFERYTHLHGFLDLIPVAWFSSKEYKSVEDVYAEALRRGVTWRELTGWNLDEKKDILL